MKLRKRSIKALMVALLTFTPLVTLSCSSSYLFLLILSFFFRHSQSRYLFSLLARLNFQLKYINISFLSCFLISLSLYQTLELVDFANSLELSFGVCHPPRAQNCLDFLDFLQYDITVDTLLIYNFLFLLNMVLEFRFLLSFSLVIFLKRNRKEFKKGSW